MAFLIVGDYLTDVRSMLQDKIEPFRYSTFDLVQAFNTALLEARRIRPDLFVDYLDSVPQYDWVDAASDLVPGTDADNDDDDNPTWTEPVPIEQGFRQAFIYGIAGHVMRRNQEDVEDDRALARIKTFENMLLSPTSTKGMAPPKG